MGNDHKDFLGNEMTCSSLWHAIRYGVIRVKGHQYCKRCFMKRQKTQKIRAASTTTTFTSISDENK